MLELMNYEGCGACEKCGDEFDCKAHTVPVTIRFTKPQWWDNWGHMVIAFNDGQTIDGEAVIDDNKVYCASAESPFWEVDDFVGLDNTEISLRT